MRAQQQTFTIIQLCNCLQDQKQQQQQPDPYQQPLSQHQLLQQQLYAQQLFAQQQQQSLFQQTPQPSQQGFGGNGHTQTSFTSSSSNTNPDGTISFTQQAGSNLNPAGGAANLYVLTPLNFFVVPD